LLGLLVWFLLKSDYPKNNSQILAGGKDPRTVTVVLLLLLLLRPRDACSDTTQSRAAGGLT
jgi:hypothetical protein